MADDTIQKECEVLTQADVVGICQALKKHHLRLLCLRECTMEGSDLQRVLKLAGSCRSLHQLTFNVGMISLPRHVELLSACIAKNSSLTGLHLHGSNLGDNGIQLLGKSLQTHPSIISLDVGDCQLGDVAVDVLYDLLLPENNRPALVELTLSANPRISAQGWARLSMAVANCTSLRMLMLDYNPLGDYSASCLLVAVAATQNMEVLDLEGCGLTEHTGQLILHLVQNHLGGLSKIVLHGNKVKKSTEDAIKTYLRENHMDTESETSTSSDFNLTLTSVTSETTSDNSSNLINNGKPSSSVSGSTDREESESEDDVSTIKGSATEEYVKALSAKEGDDDEEKERDEEEDDLGEELQEVPVFYA